MSASPDDEIDPDAPLTPYRQLVEIIRARITRGDWAPGRRMSSETQLVQQYGIARSTVRRAIAVLVDEGDVFVVPQRGTFVADEPPADEAP
ncbi:winged helix-turn-helix domain-containing protein [Streptomyces globisporus]|uniref:winged helix-turn-helix domain-containing protein n=1 Tax=Streptomyces globisporus TaxID=1908 RepID=UPI00345F203E|nr:winged helix-turn-helix domain-containing protein [Streptomyces globisporus]WSV89511.1 winged helix-turn-helix domain-containing protein [Streptomyces globisporus]